MRAAVRVLILLLALVYGLQAVAQAQHAHLGDDRHGCTFCAFGSLPGVPASTVEEPLPPECFEGRPVEPPALPPLPAIPILRLSFSTSPPVV